MSKKPKKKSYSEPNAPSHEEALAPLVLEKVKVRSEVRPTGKTLWTAKHLDVSAHGDSEKKAIENLANNWEVRRESERTWEDRRRSEKNPKGDKNPGRS